MELARLASNKQASNKQLAPQGPFWSAEQKGSQNREKKKLPRYSGWFSAIFSGTTFFRSDPQVVAKSDLLGFWPVLDRGHLEKFRVRVKNRKTRFPGARGPFGKKNRPPQKFHPGIAPFCEFFPFRRPDPQGREILKYWQPLGT